MRWLLKLNLELKLDNLLLVFFEWKAISWRCPCFLLTEVPVKKWNTNGSFMIVRNLLIATYGPFLADARKFRCALTDKRWLEQRRESSHAVIIVRFYYITIWLYHYISISLYIYMTIWLYNYIISQYNNIHTWSPEAPGLPNQTSLWLRYLFNWKKQIASSKGIEYSRDFQRKL